MKAKFKNKLLICSFLIVLLCLVIFLCYYHPQVVLDYDDWSYISGYRLPLPLPNYWNPSRILPECLMPISGLTGSLIYHLIPSMGYIKSISIVSSFFLSIFVFLYYISFYILCKNKYKFAPIYSFLLGILFLTVNFIIYIVQEKYNQHMFISTNMTCCFFYLIPALLNSSIVMILISYDNFHYFFNRLSWKKVLFLIALYFAIFSNLFGSIILAAYSGCSVLIDFICGKNKNLKVFYLRNKLLVLILLFWILGCILESVGGRARYSTGGESVLSNLFSLSIPSISLYLDKLGKVFSTLFISTICLSTLFLIITGKRIDIKLSIVIPLTLAVSTLFLSILCAKVDVTYFSRSEAIFGISFYIILIMMLLLAKISSFSKYSIYLIVCVLTVVLCNIGYSKDSYCESLCVFANPNSCIELSQYVTDQVVDADKSGKSETTVSVIKSFGDDRNNWPQTYYLGEALSKTLYRHKIISKEMNIKIIADETLNERFQIYFY